MTLVAILLLVFLIPAVFFTAIGFRFSGPRYRGPKTGHFNGRRFYNPSGKSAKGFPDVLKWALSRKPGKWTEVKQSFHGPAPPQSVREGIRIMFVNHTTFLIQTEGVNILTDPVWSERASPFSWIGPRRMRPPGIRLEDLPKIDIILLSHNHYDHLDLTTLKKLVSAFDPDLIVPLGVKPFLTQHGMKKVNEMDWWMESVVSESLTIESVPAQHFSGRGTFDRDATLWCGYVIRRQGGNIYFAGDTGYNDTDFREIADRCSPLRASIIPIGAYKPEWFMSPIHCTPREAVQIHEDVRSQTSIASHYTTFPLADDGEDEPVQELTDELRIRGISPEQFLTLSPGESRSF